MKCWQITPYHDNSCDYAIFPIHSEEDHHKALDYAKDRLEEQWDATAHDENIKPSVSMQFVDLSVEELEEIGLEGCGMPDRVFCRRHDPDGHANWDSGFRPLLDDTCYMCATSELEQAHRDATEEVAKAHKRGWEQAKREADRIGVMCKSEDDCISDGLNFGSYERGVMDAINAIAAMEYKEPTND